MAANLSKQLIEQLERLDIAVPAGDVTLKSDKLDRLHIESCHEYPTFAPYLPAGTFTLSELAVLPGETRECGCLSGRRGTRVILEVAGAAVWVAELLEIDAGLCTTERLVARPGTKATRVRKARIATERALAALDRRVDTHDDAVGVVAGLVGRLDAARVKLDGGLSPKAVADLLLAVRVESAVSPGRVDETPVLLRVTGRRTESTALIFTAIDLWEIDGDDHRVVLNVPLWAVPWFCTQAAMYGNRAEVALIGDGDDHDVIATAARLALDGSFEVFSETLEAARLLNAPAAG